MKSNALPSTPLHRQLPQAPLVPQLMSRLGIHKGPAGASSSREWNLSTLSGRLTELSSPAAGAALTAVVALVREAQLQGEPTAWITTGTSTFYPPDVDASGVDLDALPVVRAADTRSAVRAADHLLRSGAFGAVVVDLGEHHNIRMSVQSRLAGLAKKHRTALVCLTRKRSDAPSIGSLISIRGEATSSKESFNRFVWKIDVVKDKRHGPGWNHCGECRGPEGFC